jgi:hypothetical protein
VKACMPGRALVRHAAATPGVRPYAAPSGRVRAAPCHPANVQPPSLLTLLQEEVCGRGLWCAACAGCAKHGQRRPQHKRQPVSVARAQPPARVCASHKGCRHAAAVGRHACL